MNACRRVEERGEIHACCVPALRVSIVGGEFGGEVVGECL